MSKSMSGWRYAYRRPVLVPYGYSLLREEAVIVSDKTSCRFVWRDDRWLHLAHCPCWNQS